MDFAAFGNALMFFPLLIGSVIIGLLVLAYACYSVLVVIQGTAAGSDEVTWPDEPLTDWVRQSASLVGLIAIFLIPAGFLSRGLSDVWLTDAPLLRTLLLAGPTLWLVFPVGLLSSLSATSRWVFFRPIIAWQLVRLFPSTLAVYLAGAALALPTLAVWYFTLRGQPWLLLVAAPFGAAAVLVYARLLGRLGFLITQLKQPKAHKSRGKAPRKKRRVQVQVDDPWAAPEEPTGDTEPNESGELSEEEEDVTEPYGVTDSVAEEAPKPVRRRPLDAEEEDALRGYNLEATEVKPAEDKTTQVKAENTKLTEETPQLARLLPLPAEIPLRSPVPVRDLSFGDIIGFPWYPTSVSAWLRLTVGCALLGVFLLGMVMFFPA